MLAVDSPAPDFALLDQDGTKVKLADLKGQAVVLYFYPRDATPGCTTEACDFRDALPDYESLGARVLGISPDTVASHRKFADAQGLPFTLLADPEKVAIEAYGVWKEKALYGKKSWGVERTTVVIDREGVVRKVFPRVRVAGHVQKVLEAVRGLG